MTSKTNKNGFTLIEVLIYLGLYTIVIGGALTGAYSIFESSAHNETKALVEEEGAFLAGKIDWILSNAQTVSSPAAPVSPATQSVGTTLLVTRFDGSTVTVSTVGGKILLDGAVLNTSRVSVGNSLLFTRTVASGDGINPESVAVSFTVYATTTEGFPFSQQFYTNKYLRK